MSRYHELKIKSLQDTDVECSCGGWSMVSKTSDVDSRRELYRRVRDEYVRHLKYIIDKCPDDGFTVPVYTQDWKG